MGRGRCHGWKECIKVWGFAAGIPLAIILVMFWFKPPAQALGPEVEIRVIDGVECILYHRSSQGTAISCNWRHRHAPRSRHK